MASWAVCRMRNSTFGGHIFLQTCKRFLFKLQTDPSQLEYADLTVKLLLELQSHCITSSELLTMEIPQASPLEPLPTPQMNNGLLNCKIHDSIVLGKLPLFQICWTLSSFCVDSRKSLRNSAPRLERSTQTCSQNLVMFPELILILKPSCTIFDMQEPWLPTWQISVHIGDDLEWGLTLGSKHSYELR